MNTAIKYRTFQRGFAMIDNVFIDEYAAKVGPYATAVYLYLSRSADQNTRVCKRLHETIAQKCGISVASVKRAIKKLAEIDPALIEVIPHRHERGSGCNEYQILPVPLPAEAPKLKVVKANESGQDDERNRQKKTETGSEPWDQTERTLSSNRPTPELRKSETSAQSDPPVRSEGATFKYSGFLNSQEPIPVGGYESIGEEKNPRSKALLDELEKQGVAVVSINATLAMVAEWLKMQVTAEEVAQAVEAVRGLPNCPRRITVGWVDTELRKRRQGGRQEARRDRRMSESERQSRMEWAQNYWEEAMKQKTEMDAKLREYAERQQREASHEAHS